MGRRAPGEGPGSEFCPRTESSALRLRGHLWVLCKTSLRSARKCFEEVEEAVAFFKSLQPNEAGLKGEESGKGEEWPGWRRGGQNPESHQWEEEKVLELEEYRRVSHPRGVRTGSLN